MIEHETRPRDPNLPRGIATGVGETMAHFLGMKPPADWYLIRQVIEPLHIPTIRDVGSLLVHAVPRESYEKYATREAAEEAIKYDRYRRVSDVTLEFEIVTVAYHEAETADRASRLAAPTRRKKEKAEE